MLATHQELHDFCEQARERAAADHTAKQHTMHTTNQNVQPHPNAPNPRQIPGLPDATFPIPPTLRRDTKDERIDPRVVAPQILGQEEAERQGHLHGIEAIRRIAMAHAHKEDLMWQARQPRDAYRIKREEDMQNMEPAEIMTRAARILLPPHPPSPLNDIWEWPHWHHNGLINWGERRRKYRWALHWYYVQQQIWNRTKEKPEQPEL